MADRQKADKLFKEYYFKYGEKIRKFCFARLPGDTAAEDCVQETFMVLYKQLVKEVEILNAGAFLYKTADNFVKQRWRENQKANNTVPIDDLSETLSAPEQEPIAINLDYDEFAKLLITKLDADEQNLYCLRFAQKQKIPDVAEQLGISLGAATMRIKRLREKLMSLAKDMMNGEVYK